MKIRIPLLMLALALAASSAVTAQASVCSNSTIQGSFAFTIHGTIFLPNGATILINGLSLAACGASPDTFPQELSVIHMSHS